MNSPFGWVVKHMGCSALFVMKRNKNLRSVTAPILNEWAENFAKKRQSPSEPKFKKNYYQDLTYEINGYPKPQKFRAKKPKVERQASFGEKTVANWLLKNSIKFKREKQFVDLINPDTGQRLWLDFYIHTHKIVIEFDGRQHFERSAVFDKNGETLEIRMRRDKIKDAYCVQKGFTLIRIKYNELNLVDKILTELFKQWQPK